MPSGNRSFLSSGGCCRSSSRSGSTSPTSESGRRSGFEASSTERCLRSNCRTEVTPIVYLPGVSRQELRAVQECPDSLKPLVELQYRGACWTQKNGKDWTVEAFLVSEEGGLGLDVARDATTRRAMLGALAELATTSVDRLKGKHLEAEDFDKLFSDDPAKDLLLWLSEPEAVKSGWNSGRWSAFKSRCKADFKFDPDKDGELVGAELLGRREGPWAAVWERFTESPVLYPGVPELLRKAMPSGPVRGAFSPGLKTTRRKRRRCGKRCWRWRNRRPPRRASEILELEKSHGPRRQWVWAKLGQAPLANALGHLAELAERAATKLGGASTAEMAKLYVDSGLGGRHRGAVCDGRGEVDCRCAGRGQGVERRLPALAGVGG